MQTLNIRLQKHVSKVISPAFKAPNIQGAMYSHGSLNAGTFSYNGYACDEHVYGVHLEKHRGKWETCTTYGRNGKAVEKKVWVPKHWVKTVTRFPKSILMYLPKGSKFVQHKHHWELITAK